MKHRGDLQRFTYAERLIHWVAGLSFVFLLFTGLAFSHPRLFWITDLVGVGPPPLVLH
ncbi:MAG: formate dehydrogenase cytochrome b556 subunit, partial [Gemmatimonadetes bacterium]|nr:formate dehydrogenase cytochrome b556 subunit [Gemmatimonadota bacterium]